MKTKNENSNLIETIPDKTNYTRFCVLLYGLFYGFALNITRRAQPQYVYSYLKDRDKNISNDSLSNTCTDTNEDSIQQEASSWSWYFILVEYGLSTPVVILVGPMSDKVGRKPVLIWNGFLTFLSYVFRTLVIYKNLSLYYLLAAHVIDGLSGSFYSFDLCNHAIITDITAVDNSRSFLMVLFNSVLGVSVMTASLLSGYIIKWTGYTLPFLITTCVLLFYVIFLKSTLKEQRDTHHEPVKPTRPNQFLQIFSLFSKESLQVERKNLIVFMIAYFLYYFTFNSFDVLRTLYLLGPPFCWSSVHIGWLGSAEDVELFILATFIMKGLQCFMRDETINMLGLVSFAGCLAVTGMSSTDAMIYGATSIGILRILCIPMMKSIVSRMVHSDKQGVLFANISLIEVVCAVFGATVFNNIYHETRPFYKGFVFFVMASCLGIATCISMLGRCLS